MKKCNNCGREFPDSANVCSQCGTRLSSPDEGNRCPSCGELNPAGSVFCMKCGARLVAPPPPPPVKPEPVGANGTGGAYNEVKPAYSESAAHSTPATPERSDDEEVEPPPPYIDNPVGIKQKVVAFEYKKNIIGNIVLLVMALTVALMSLLTPINLKLRTHSVVPSEQVGDVKIYESDTYVEIKQDVFKAIGAIFFMAAGEYEVVDEKIINPYEEEYAKRLREAEAEIAEWFTTHPMPTNEAELEEYSKEYQAAYRKIISKHLSKMNYIAYALTAATTGERFEEALSFETFFNVAFSFAIAMLAVTLAVVAVVNLVIGILGLVRRKRSTHLFSFLGTAAVLSAVQLILTLAAPNLIALGGAFATTLVVMLVYLIAGAARAIVLERVPVGVIIKNTVIAGLMIAAFFLLCGNTVAVTSTLTVKTPDPNNPDRFIYTVVSTVKILGDSSMLSHQMFNFSDYMVEGSTLPASTVVGGILTALSLLISTIIIGVGATKQLKFNALDHEKNPKLSGTTSALTTAIVLATIVIFQLAFFAGSDSYATITGSDLSGISTKYEMRAVTWISIVFMIGLFVFDKVFKPDKKKKQAAEIPA
ncbi:MAG: zinc ribbon domain-containing protein [Clostridiales bacterium]|nr:zinc ribbon domain-containing protein [Clostridiales bacterium]